MISYLEFSAAGQLIDGLITNMPYYDFHFTYSSLSDFTGEPFCNRAST